MRLEIASPAHGDEWAGYHTIRVLDDDEALIGEMQLSQMVVDGLTDEFSPSEIYRILADLLEQFEEDDDADAEPFTMTGPGGSFGDRL